MVLELTPRTINSIIAKSFQATTLEATHPLTDPLICWVVTRSHWSKVFTSKVPEARSGLKTTKKSCGVGLKTWGLRHTCPRALESKSQTELSSDQPLSHFHSQTTADSAYRKVLRLLTAKAWFRPCTSCAIQLATSVSLAHPT